MDTDKLKSSYGSFREMQGKDRSIEPMPKYKAPDLNRVKKGMMSECEAKGGRWANGKCYIGEKEINISYGRYA